VARIATTEAPALFQDFTRTDDGTWVAGHGKV
jgi:hypothetical protein